MKLDDRFFRKIFTALMTLGFMLFFILIMNIFLEEPMNSVRLWVGALIIYFSINLIADLKGFVKKLIALGVSVIGMTLFFHSMLNWSLAPSLYVGGVILILSGLLYMSFMN